MAISLDRDLVRDTSVSLLFSKIAGILQYGRVTRAYLVRGLDPIIDANGTDGTVATRAVDAVKAEIPVGTPHTTYTALLARDYSFATVNTPGMGEVIVAYIFDDPRNPDYTLDMETWLESIDVQDYRDGTGNLNPIVVDNYLADWVDDTVAAPTPGKLMQKVYGTVTMMIPRVKYVVTKTVGSATAQTVQNAAPGFISYTNSAVIFGEPIGTVLCGGIVTASEPWLGRATVRAEFLARPEGWKRYMTYTSPATNGRPGNVWRSHPKAGGGTVNANGVKEFTVQPSTDLNTLLGLF